MGSKPTFQDTKTESGRRVISLPREGVDVLKRHRAAQAKERLRLGPIWKDQGLIFPNDFGGPIFPDNLRRAFIRIIDDAGVSKIRIHDLRHTHGSLLLLNKVPLQTVSERLGHSRPSTTSDLYAHTLADSQDEAAAVMDALLGQNRGSKRGA